MSKTVIWACDCCNAETPEASMVHFHLDDTDDLADICTVCAAKELEALQRRAECQRCHKMVSPDAILHYGNNTTSDPPIDICVKCAEGTICNLERQLLDWPIRSG